MVVPQNAELPVVFCAQIGARDHYAYPRAFSRAGMLGGLITDYWHGKLPSLPGWLSPRGAGRRHPDLGSAAVLASNAATLGRAGRLRLRGESGWAAVMANNRGFQQDAIKHLRRFAGRVPPGKRVVLFSYSYAARELFHFAKEHGWYTVLGQIDPGPEEGRLVQELRMEHPEWQCSRVPPPDDYYNSWREETELADRILANSDWTAEALVRGGVDEEKIVVVPIPFDPPRKNPPDKDVPTKFSASRPLRLLFLGQVNLRKGIFELLEAMRIMRDEPIELTIVGATQVKVPPTLCDLPSLKWIGPVPRADAADFFDAADAFILPTHSDGFGLTQLEALAHRLTVIVSKHCARLVEDDIHGRVLPEVGADAIASSLREILDNPSCLARWSARCAVPGHCRPQAVADQLRDLVSKL